MKLNEKVILPQMTTNWQTTQQEVPFYKDVLEQQKSQFLFLHAILFKS